MPKQPLKGNWATGAWYTRALEIPNGPTQWEKKLAALGLDKQPESEWVLSIQLKAFAIKQQHQTYVPEWFLLAIGEDVVMD